MHIYPNLYTCLHTCMYIRGMSTAGAIEYTSQVHNNINSKTIKFLVLDSPYASVKQVVDTVLSEFQNKVTYNLGIKQSYMFICV
jgi:hypothetical protein